MWADLRDRSRPIKWVAQTRELTASSSAWLWSRTKFGEWLSDWACITKSTTLFNIRFYKGLLKECPGWLLVIFFLHQNVFSESPQHQGHCVSVHTCAIPFVLFSPTASDYVCLLEAASAHNTMTNRAEIIFKIQGMLVSSFLTIGNITNPLLRKKRFYSLLGFSWIFKKRKTKRVVQQRSLS